MRSDRALVVQEWLNAHKPATSARYHLLLAALMWTIVGAVLLLCGARWVLAAPTAYSWALLAVAVLAGVCKARFVLGRAARRLIGRIDARGDGRCIGGFLSVRTWALVAAMALAGRMLRGGAPRVLVGLVYVAVGTALLLAGRHIWYRWHARTNDA